MNIPSPVARCSHEHAPLAVFAGSSIFRRETQKVQALFPDGDQREFWQRTEDRSRRLARAYNTLGLAGHEPGEAFKRYRPGEFINHATL